MFHANDKVGPYILIKFLGRGSFGEVWLGEKRTRYATTQYALKFPDMNKVDSDAIQKEAAVWVKASGHPNVLPIIEADEYDGHIVIVSELAPDGSLGEWLTRHSGKASSIDIAVRMMKGILAGLEHLHSKRITHRDLKPDNILLQGDTPRLADFGLARVIKTIQTTQSVAGTPLYMSPEAYASDRTAQMDLWAAAVIFYQLLSGDVPFTGETPHSLMFAILTKEAKPLSDEIPKPLRDFVATALNKDISKRYPTASAMRQAMDEALQPEPTHIIVPPEPTPEPMPAPPLQPQPAPELDSSVLGNVSADTQLQPAPEPQLNPQLLQSELTPQAQIVTAPQPKPITKMNRIIAGIVGAVLVVGGSIWGAIKLNSGKPDPPTVTQPLDSAGTNQLKETKTDVSTFVQIPVGEFMMGGDKYADEKPLHKVKISKAFEIGKYEVTQAQWKAVMGANPSNFKGENLPVEQVSWNDTQEFIKKLNARNDGYIYRLPTEAEWEYACRAGTTGDYAGNLDEMGWYTASSGDKTHPVGEKKANAWGLYDMHGNVWEWCSDWYDGGYYGKSSEVDPKGSESGSARVERGGGWYGYAAYCRSAYRCYDAPGVRFIFLGFRLVRTNP
jgi:formylglycine-generating enzyme required for sulfatase activity/tRNA A-37 threonylcarbamoyl transferase component Bud32